MDCESNINTICGYELPQFWAHLGVEDQKIQLNPMAVKKERPKKKSPHEIVALGLKIQNTMHCIAKKFKGQTKGVRMIQRGFAQP